MPAAAVDALVDSDVGVAAELLSGMRKSLDEMQWGSRSFDYANIPLGWLQRIASAAAQHNQIGLLEDAVTCLFAAEVRWERFEQRKKARAWLELLRDEPAATVARVLRRHPEAGRWYQREGWRARGAHPLVKQALSAATAGERENE